jgi:hypothetical protein
MLPSVKWLLLFATGVTLTCASVPPARAQVGAYQQFRVSPTPAGPSYSYRAGFNAPPMVNPYDAPNPSAPYYDPYAGYLSGYAGTLDPAGQYLISQQYAKVVGQQAQQAKIDTRRQAFDEWLYERDKTPTLEDDRERARMENLRRQYNDPPITEIWSGLALNTILDAITKEDKQRGPGPEVPLNTADLRDINLSAGGLTGSVGLIRDGGKIQWPFVFRGSAFTAQRKTLDRLALQAYNQARGGGVDPDTLQGMTDASNRLSAQLLAQVSNLDPNQYIAGKRFLNDLSNTITALQDPQVGNYLTGKWSAQGNTVAQLVAYMNGNGLRFGPADPGDQAAYVSLYRSLVAYYGGPTLTASPPPR